MSSSDAIVRFISFLAIVRSMFRQAHLFVEKETSVRDVSTQVEPFKGEESQYADAGATLSIALNANLRDPADSERQAIGMSLLIRRSSGNWIAEAEVGWTGREVGWDPFASKELQFSTLEALMVEVLPLVTWMDATLRDTVLKLKGKA